MATHINGQGVRVCAFAPRKHVADLIDTHGHPGVFAPLLKKMPPFAVFIRKGLAIVAPGDARANFGHLHQAVP